MNAQTKALLGVLSILENLAPGHRAELAEHREALTNAKPEPTAKAAKAKAPAAKKETK